MHATKHAPALFLLSLVVLSCSAPDLYKPQKDWPTAASVEGVENVARGPFLINRPTSVNVSTAHFWMKSILFTREDDVLKATVAVYCESDPGTSRRIEVTLIERGGEPIKTAEYLYEDISTTGLFTSLR